MSVYIKSKFSYSPPIRPSLLRGSSVRHLLMVPITPIRMVCRLTLWHCCGRACFNLICCSVALANCCTGRVSSQYLFSTRCTSQREGCKVWVSFWWPFCLQAGSILNSIWSRFRSKQINSICRKIWKKPLG